MLLKIGLSVFLLLTLGACNEPPAAEQAIDIFRGYLVGDFDNQRQIDAERAAGQQVHPYATHINRLADEKIINAPNRNGFWLIEESYYINPDSTEQINHHLFFFEGIDATTVRLYAYQLSPSLQMEQLTNDNPDLQIDYGSIQVSPKFKPADYTLEGDTFRIRAPNDMGNGITFTLIETFTPGRLEVMELVEKDGQRLTPYDTPLIYEKK